MRWIGIEIKDKTLASPSNQTQFLIFFTPPPPSPPSELYGFGSSSLNSRVSSSVLLIIVILAVIFFISGLVHLLIRLLLKPPNREPDDSDNVTAIQGQLQQLFHLHDFGVDQSFIDALPVFSYKSVIGLKDPFDCAVCLCEFEADDKLRLLPKCSHAFHMDCIDTWLLSHSTCPLCRASLLTDFSQSTNFSPVVLLLESGTNGESSREIVSEREQGLPGTNSTARVSSRLRSRPESFRSNEILAKIGETHGEILSSGEKVLQVKLGKLKNVDGGRGECSNNDNPSPDARRCFSMGSFAYVMDENSSLQVPIGTPPLNKRQPSTSKKPYLPLTPRHRHVLSESGGGELNVMDGFKILEFHDSKPIGKESFSISKIWVRGKKDAASDPCRRAVSLRFPEQIYSSSGDEKNNRRTTSEIHMSRWANESRYQEETRSDFSSDYQPNPPSLARRTLLWFMDGKPNRNVRPFFSNA